MSGRPGSEGRLRELVEGAVSGVVVTEDGMNENMQMAVLTPLIRCAAKPTETGRVPVWAKIGAHLALIVSTAAGGALVGERISQNYPVSIPKPTTSSLADDVGYNVAQQQFQLEQDRYCALAGAVSTPMGVGALYLGALAAAKVLKRNRD
ncbi:MAG: hypothetical protein KJ600_05735 [Nanoarchaeota archaeon]|nr:hypothetical protein [Nanoarchaeota archaeon]